MMTPSEILDRLVELLREDNGPLGAKHATPEQRGRGEIAIGRMLTAGWDPEALSPGMEPEFEYANDMEVMAMGEADDADHLAELYKDTGGPELAEVVDDIFDQPE